MVVTSGIDAFIEKKPQRKDLGKMGRIGEKAAKPSSIGESFNQLKRLVKIGGRKHGKIQRV